MKDKSNIFEQDELSQSEQEEENKIIESKIDKKSKTDKKK